MATTPLEDIEWLIQLMKDKLPAEFQPSTCNYFSTAVRLKHLILTGKEDESQVAFDPETLLNNLVEA